MATAEVASTYGTVLIGLLFATFFQGVLSVQSYVYYERFPEDSWKMKLLVAAVWVVDCVHLIIIAETTYFLLVTSWGDLSVLPFSTWEQNVHAMLVGVATVLCQMFFLHRIYMFSNRNKILTIALSALCLATFAFDLSLTILSLEHLSVPIIQQGRSVQVEVIGVFTVGAFSDVVMALLLCYYLQRGRSGFEKTNSIVAQLVRYTVSTGLITSLLAVGCLIAYFASPTTLIFIAMHFSLGRMYTNALLATLNSRESLRQKLLVRPHHHEPPASVQISGFRSPNSASFGSPENTTLREPGMELQKMSSFKV